jgi:hypothetical protein
VARRWVTRNRDGSYSLHLDDDLADLVATLAGQLDPLLDDPSADTGLRRLFPPAHPDDLIAEAEWQIEQGASLLDSRRTALEAVRSAGPSARLDEEQLIAWVQGLNSLRLVLAERLQVADDPTGEDEAVRVAAELSQDPDLTEEEREAARRLLGTWQVYELLATMIDHAVRALG